MTIRRQPINKGKQGKLSLSAFVFRDVDSDRKDWFGYLRIKEEDVEPLAKILRHGAWSTDREGSRELCLKISGWDRQSQRGDWVKLLIGEPSKTGDVFSQVFQKPDENA